MVRNTLKATLTVLALLATLVFAMNAPAVEYNDAAALKGVKTGKGIFLVNLDNPQKAALYLSIIKSTHESMEKQKTKPDFVVVFVGQTVRFLTTEPEAELASKYKESLESIALSVKALNGKGVRQEVCVIATDFFKVSNDKLLPGLKPVGNGFTSLIGYQGKGYGLVPVM